jgi:L-fuculokinase
MSGCDEGDALIVLDIGKTNVKLALIDADGVMLAERRTPNTIWSDGPYPHHDIEGIWDWMLETMPRTSRSVATCRRHRAGDARRHRRAGRRRRPGAAGARLRIRGPEDAITAVGRPTPRLFAALPAGLNLGRQLAWLAQRYPRISRAPATS